LQEGHGGIDDAHEARADQQAGGNVEHLLVAQRGPKLPPNHQNGPAGENVEAVCGEKKVQIYRS